MNQENASDLIRWLEVLSNGYIKPDVNKSTTNVHGVVRDTKKFFPYIDQINKALCEKLGVEKPDVHESDY